MMVGHEKSAFKSHFACSWRRSCGCARVAWHGWTSMQAKEIKNLFFLKKKKPIIPKPMQAVGPLVATTREEFHLRVACSQSKSCVGSTAEGPRVCETACVPGMEMSRSRDKQSEVRPSNASHFCLPFGRSHSRFVSPRLAWLLNLAHIDSEHSCP